MLNYKTFGQGPPLVILHGLFGTLDNWQTLARRWAEEHTVFLVDLRNHGRSPHLDAMTYPLMAADLKTFLEEKFVFQTHLLGHSMGGKVAMQFALDYPDMMEKLVVVDIAPKPYNHGHNAVFDAFNAVDPATLTDRSEAEELMRPHVPEDDVRLFLLKNLSRSKDGGFAWKMNLAVIERDYPHIIAGMNEDATAFEGPTLFVRGADSDYVSDGDLPAIHRFFPAATLETIAGAGHWIHAQQPEVLYEMVREFLRE